MASRTTRAEEREANITRGKAEQEERERNLWLSIAADRRARKVKTRAAKMRHKAVWLHHALLAMRR